MKKMSTRNLVNAAFFAALATILYFMEFRIPGHPLKMDLSDLPVLIASLISGPVVGVMVALVKNILHFFIISGDSNIAGELANFMFSVMLVMTTLLYSHKRTLIGLVKMAFGILVASVIMNVLNYAITFPLYGLSREGAWVILNTIYFPFNIIKGVLLWIIVYTIYPVISKATK